MPCGSVHLLWQPHSKNVNMRHCKRNVSSCDGSARSFYTSLLAITSFPATLWAYREGDNSTHSVTRQSTNNGERSVAHEFHEKNETKSWNKRAARVCFFYINEVVIQFTHVNVNNSVVAGVYPVHCHFYSQTQFFGSNLYLGCIVFFIFSLLFI